MGLLDPLPLVTPVISRKVKPVNNSLKRIGHNCRNEIKQHLLCCEMLCIQNQSTRQHSQKHYCSCIGDLGLLSSIVMTGSEFE